jgi:hypothetical protein
MSKVLSATDRAKVLTSQECRTLDAVQVGYMADFVHSVELYC